MCAHAETDTRPRAPLSQHHFQLWGVNVVAQGKEQSRESLRRTDVYANIKQERYAGGLHL